MRDHLVMAIVLGSVPVIFFRPFVGLVVYSWLAFMRPQDMAFGASRELPLSLWVAIAMVIGLALALGRERAMTLHVQTILLALLGIWISGTVLNAVSRPAAMKVYGNYWKAIVISLLTTGLVRDRRRLRTMLLLIAFSIGFLGAKRGLFGLVRGGIRYDDGPGGFMSDNNSFALALNMVLPLLVGFALTEEKRWVRLVSAGAAALCMLSILFTFSRGGLLTLLVVGCMLVWRSQHRFLVAALLALGIGGFALISSSELMEQYVERASTISHYEEDGSALGRLTAWKASWKVFHDHPILGIGPNNLQVVWTRYAGTARFHVAHNAYLQLLAECGLPGLLLFLGVIATAFWHLQKLRAATAVPWIETQARMIQISIVGYLVGSMFLNTAYQELIYHLVALSVCAEVVAGSLALSSAEGGSGGEAQPVPADGGIPWWQRPRPGRLGPAAPTWTGGA